MNVYFKFLLVLLFLSPVISNSAIAQSSGKKTALSLGKKEVWHKNQLIEPAALRSLLNDPAASKPPVYNIGFVSNIPGSANLGAARDKNGLDKLKKAVKNVSKNRMVVIYCGCCPFEHCPNVLPAYSLLKSLGYTQTKILNLPTSLKADWIDKGYPVGK
jgi:hypothetical protein